MPVRHAEDSRRQAHPIGRGRQGREERPAFVAGPAAEDVVVDRDEIEAEPLGRPGRLGRIPTPTDEGWNVHPEEDCVVAHVRCNICTW